MVVEKDVLRLGIRSALEGVLGVHKMVRYNSLSKERGEGISRGNMSYRGIGMRC